MWWFSQEWLNAAWGGWTGLSNYPNGAFGAVLSPISAGTWGILEPLVGAARAAALVGVTQIGGMAVAVLWLARRVGLGLAPAVVAGLAPLVLRYSYYGLGEGSVVAVVGLVVPLGVIALLDAAEGSRRGGGLAGLAMGVVAMENPYLAPVLPVVALVLAVQSGPGRRHLVGAVALGTLANLGVAALFSRAASPDYPMRRPDSVIEWLGRTWDIVDMPWARADLIELVWSPPVRWTLEVIDGEGAGGGSYLGLSVLLLAAIGGVLSWRSCRIWLAFGMIGVLLSLGSLLWNLVPTPFLFLNTLMDVVARPLTQPTRYLVLVPVGFGIAAGFGVQALGGRWRHAGLAAVALVSVDAFAFGGLSMTLPETSLPSASCVRRLADEPGAVLVWPADASRWEGDLLRSWMLQMMHERPSANPGIASWALYQTRSRDMVQETGGFKYLSPIGTPDGQAVSEVRPDALREMGFRWVIGDLERAPTEHTWLNGNFGQPAFSCDGASVYDLGAGP